jgi:hypothetical protein
MQLLSHNRKEVVAETVRSFRLDVREKPIR